MGKQGRKQRNAQGSGARSGKGAGGAGGARKQPATDEAKIRLSLFGEEREIACEVRVGPSSLRDLLPAARSISRQVAAAAVAHAEAEGRAVSCRLGCAACCRQLVPVSPVEAEVLAERVAALPEPRRSEVRRRFAEAVARLEEIGLLDPAAPRGRIALRSAAVPGEDTWKDITHRYFAAWIRCPFLDDDETCGMYEERPVTCREYAVTSPPERCATLGPGIQTIERPVYMDDALTGVSAKFSGLPRASIPLVLALEWAEVHGQRTRGAHDGEAMFWKLLEQMGSVDREGEP